MFTVGENNVHKKKRSVSKVSSFSRIFEARDSTHIITKDSSHRAPRCYKI